MRLLLNAALALLLPVSAHAARAVMENIAASNNTVFVDTQTKRVHLSTQAYGDGVPTVSLYTTSNVVVGDNNACVLYATGTAACKSFVGSIDYSTITAALNAKLSSVTINASLRNPQASASLPLGVDSSSVAIKNSSGFVLNMEIDPSSVTKLSGGLVPNWLLDSSSVTKQGPIVSSISATGVGGSKQTCGSDTVSCSFDVNPDGRITRVSSATISGSSSSVLRSSQTFLGSVTTSLTTFSTCYATATLQSVSVGSATVYGFVYGLSAAVTNVLANVLVNGQYVNGHTSTTNAMAGNFCNGANDCSFSINESIDISSAGDVSVCLQLKSTGGSTFTTYSGASGQPRAMIGIRQ
jgi:hypothetical protein